MIVTFEVTAENVVVGKYDCDTLILADGTQICFGKHANISRWIGQLVTVSQKDGKCTIAKADKELY